VVDKGTVLSTGSEAVLTLTADNGSFDPFYFEGRDEEIPTAILLFFRIKGKECETRVVPVRS